MADSSVGVVDAVGTTKQIDARSLTNGDLRQVVTLGDPDSTTGVAAVVDGALAVTQTGPGPAAMGNLTVAHYSATPSTSAQTVFPSRSTRRGGLLFNASSGDVYVYFGTGASTSTFDLIITPGSGYELLGDENLRVTQNVSIAWAESATGTLRATEWMEP